MCSVLSTHNSKRGREKATTVICVGIKFYAGNSTNEITSPAFHLFPLPSFSIILLLSDLITLPQLFFLLLSLVEWDGRCALSAAHHIFFRTHGSMRPSFVCVSAFDRVTLLAVDFIELCAVIVCRVTVLRYGFRVSHTQRRLGTAQSKHTPTLAFSAFCCGIYSPFALFSSIIIPFFFSIRLHRRRRRRRCRYHRFRCQGCMHYVHVECGYWVYMD